MSYQTAQGREHPCRGRRVLNLTDDSEKSIGQWNTMKVTEPVEHVPAGSAIDLTGLAVASSTV